MSNTLRYNNTIPGNIYYNNAKVQNVYYNNTKVWSASRPFAFTYTGAYETEGNLEGNFIIRFKTSGTLTITSHGNNTNGSYDLFAVGGGGGGGWYSDPSGVLPFGGGGGGYTKTSLGVALSVGSYQITIGAGGGQNVDGQTTSFGSQLSVSGGTAAKEYWSSSDIPYSGGDGGSGAALIMAMVVVMVQMVLSFMKRLLALLGMDKELQHGSLANPQVGYMPVAVGVQRMTLGTPIISVVLVVAVMVHVDTLVQRR